MNTVDINIQSLADAAKGKAAVQGIDPHRMIEVPSFAVAILEAGTQSGATSVMLILKDGTGGAYVAQCSANLFDQINGAVQGAVARFGK